MESMTNYQLLDLFASYLSFIEAQIQYWLSITFAVIVTSYLAAEKLSIKLRGLMLFLYLITSIYFIGRHYISMEQTTFIIAELRSRDVGWPGSRIFNVVGTRVIFSCGILATLLFVLFHDLHSKGKK